MVWRYVSCVIALGEYFSLRQAAVLKELTGEGIAGASLSVKSVSAARVNDAVFKHSIVRTYTGGTGGMGRFLILRNGESRGLRTRVGIAAEAVTAQFTSLKSSVVTSDNAEIVDETTTGSNMALTLLSASLVIGFIF